MFRLAVLFLLAVITFRTSSAFLPLIADALKQTVDIFLTNQPLAGSDPRQGLLKLACVPCQFVVKALRFSTQNIPGLGPLLTGLCTFIIGDQQTCTDQIGFIALALETADNRQLCERFWACARPDPDDSKRKRKDSKSRWQSRHRHGRNRMDSPEDYCLPEDSILLSLPHHLNETDVVSNEILKQIYRQHL